MSGFSRPCGRTGSQGGKSTNRLIHLKNLNMLDTIITRFNPLPLRQGLIQDPDQFGELVGLPGWKYDLGRPKNISGRSCRRFKILAPLGPGPRQRELTIFGNGETIDGYKVSLPALVHGSNLSLITSQEEIDTALMRASALINQVADFNPRAVDLHFTRVDLALHHSPPGIPPSAFFASFKNCRTMRIRGNTVSYWVMANPSGISLNGTALTIKAYDKVLKHTGRPGAVTRIELELRREVLMSLLGNPDGGYPRRLSFDRCYRVYRELLLGLEPPRRILVNGPIGSLKDFAALAAARSDDPDDLLSIYRQNFTVPVFIDFRRRLADAQLALHEISIADLLPEVWPPSHLVCNAAAEARINNQPTS
jgi:hypothetical protein